MATWLTADPHFGHALVAKDRGFDTVEEHDDALFCTYAKAFREGDDIWWLGDMAFDGWKDRLRVVMRALPGRHHLILGNHDRAHPLNSRAQDYQATYFALGFTSVSLFARVSYKGKGAFLSHFPYVGDDGDRADRFAEWRLRDEGKLLFHGHTHGREMTTTSPAGTTQVHVGLDAWGLSPVSIAEAFTAAEAI